MNKILKAGILSAALVGAAVVGAPYVSAQGNGFQDGSADGEARRYGSPSGQGLGRSTMLESRSALLGMSVDGLQAAIDDGKTMQEVAMGHGLSQEEYRAKVREQAKARWADRGLSDEEVAERTTQQEERQADCDGTGSRRGEGGYGLQYR